MTKRKKKIRKTKEEIFKKVKDSVMMKEIFNEYFEKTSNSIKSPDEAVDVVNKMEKCFISKKSNI